MGKKRTRYDGRSGRGSPSSTSSPPFRRSPYAVLNLSEIGDDHRSRSGLQTYMKRDVTQEEIREAYKRLSLLFHPDKQQVGEARGQAQEMFHELTNSYEILADPTLRQAYDYFGHRAVDLLRKDRYDSDSLYSKLSRLHDSGKSLEALELLRTIVEGINKKQREDEWEFNAGVRIDLRCKADESFVFTALELPDVSATNVSLNAAVPISSLANTSHPPSGEHDRSFSGSLKKEQKMQLSIGGESNLENGLGSTRGVISTSYRPRPQIAVTSDVKFGRDHLETSISSAKQLSNGTGMSTKMTRVYGRGNDGDMTFEFSSNRSLSLFQNRVVMATFALGMSSNLQMHYSLLQLTSFAFHQKQQVVDDEHFDGQSHDGSEEEQKHSKEVKTEPSSLQPSPWITAKLTFGSRYPLELSIMQPHLFNCPNRTGNASISWSPLTGCDFKGSLSRDIPTSWIHRYSSDHDNDLCATFEIGIKHNGMQGFTWVFNYKRPEGLSVRIPIFLSSFLAPAYWNRVIWISTLSFLIDETFGEIMGHHPPTSLDEFNNHETYENMEHKMRACDEEKQWIKSSHAKEEAQLQSTFIEYIASLKTKTEESDNGLVILKAKYECKSSRVACRRREKSLDVTHQLQFWVKDSTLSLPASSKSHLLGFYDLRQDQKFSKHLISHNTQNSRAIGSMN
ncbi:hypothetical protein ACHAXS_003999 [Conticribra weissflogii]